MTLAATATLYPRKCLYVIFAPYFSVSMNWWSKSTSYISPFLRYPIESKALISRELSVSAVLKS